MGASEGVERQVEREVNESRRLGYHRKCFREQKPS